MQAYISEGNKHCVENRNHQGIKQPRPAIMVVRMMKPFYINEHWICLSGPLDSNQLHGCGLVVS